jgi:DNA primase
MRHKIFFVIDYHKTNNHLKKSFDIGDLQRSGLFNKKEDGSGNLVFAFHRIIIPYIHNNEIIYMRGRYFDNENNASPKDQFSKYKGLYDDGMGLNKTKRFYNTDMLKKMLPGERLLIVEGELDAVAGETLGINTIAIPGATNIPDQAQFDRLMAFDITLCGDNDEAGQGLTNKLKKIFLDMGKTITIKHLNKKDLNEFIAA